MEVALKFYLGTHLPGWLSKCSPDGSPHFQGIRLFVSARRLRDRAGVHPKAQVSYAIDSGGFSEITLNGSWTVKPSEYVADLRRWFHELGPAEWCAPQDWMCEPHMLEKTGKTVDEHQRLTIDNYLELRSLAPELPFAPVLQGWTVDDYLTHAFMYEGAGVNLPSLPLVGVGSICRRQATGEAEEIMRSLWQLGLKLHGFGFKLDGLRRSGRYMESADSMAWSFTARRLQRPLPGCVGHKNCANCWVYAKKWYDEKVMPIINSTMRVAS